MQHFFVGKSTTKGNGYQVLCKHIQRPLNREPLLNLALAGRLAYRSDIDQFHGKVGTHVILLATPGWWPERPARAIAGPLLLANRPAIRGLPE